MQNEKESYEYTVILLVPAANVRMYKKKKGKLIRVKRHQ